MSTVKLNKLVSTLPSAVPFVAPEMMERERGAVFKARLGANENNFGPSPQVHKAIAEIEHENWKYPDPSSIDLRTALAGHLNLSVENIIVGGGIDGLLGNLCRMYLDQGNKVVTSAGAYPTFNYHVSGFGGELVFVPYKNDHEDLGALCQTAHDTKAKLVYLSNPDNPMGTIHTPDAVQRFASELPKTTLLILDEAYIEFAQIEAIPNIDINTSNIVRFRTFSKAYGLAGARIGYGLANPEMIRNFDKIRDHFGVSKISQVAALAALQDQRYLKQTLNSVADGRAEIARIGIENGLEPLASATNFVTMDCGSDGDFARRLLAELLNRGIFVRMPFVAPQDRCIRVSVGLPHEIALFEQALPAALVSARV